MVQLPVDNHGRHQAPRAGRCAAGRQSAGVLAHAVRAIGEDGLHFHDLGHINAIDAHVESEQGHTDDVSVASEARRRLELMARGRLRGVGVPGTGTSVSL